MEMENKKTKKRGLAALLITGAVVGIGVGTTHVIKKVAQQKAKADEMKRLKELEDEEFDDLFE
ncbi:hypothetical protein J0J70_05010 [Turicibacter bilis]|uniref:DUF3042 domain-containing protein n=1 Tax=Turicibacter bilis TaxID=2735723 RepID=A0A9Q9CT08_9FIRM|nr:hypothetical protein [Turicibacter bilis]MBS3198264.1 hypothetical protein [Turicibacter bilis]MBS3200571.1 hypothetical protein [Turicibacter bilis]UUF05221.1 hypothetical protein J0J69_08970 [Turicibacter bilis]UUF09323.1 hypothetical protein J0J70_05010 [Turicibacter bilis]